MADRKISDLTALTTPASGDYLPIVDISEAAAASKNKRITIEELMRGVPDGTAAAPGIAFETDPNTGIYSPGADQLAVATNGTGRLFVDATGRVGVGVSPTQELDIFANKDGLTTSWTRNPNTGSSAGARLLVGSHLGDVSLIAYSAANTAFGANTAVLSSSSAFTGGLNLFAGGAAPLVLWTNSNERLRITSAGLVGIGTSSPTTRFHVDFGDAAANSIRLVGDGATNGTALATSWFSGASYFDVRLGGNTTSETKLRVTSAGLVGIGTTSPVTTLDVNGGSQFTGSVSGYSGGEVRLGATTVDLQHGLSTQSTGTPIMFFDHRGTSNAGIFAWRVGTNGASERMRIDSSGRLLVGTSTASGANLLQVNSDALVNGITVGRGAGAISTNTAVGSGALQANTTGGSNTANGRLALSSNTTGAENVANGYAALYSNTTGGNNTANGNNALYSNTTGGNNTAIGLEAGYGDGTQANTTGTNNTFIGYDAMGASATASNVITLGNGSITTLRAQVTTITALSDERDKKNIAPLNAGLDFLTKLRPVSFTWDTRDKAKVDVEDTGFIAQELLAVQENTGITIPNLVSQENPDKLEAGYGTLIPVLVSAVQELTAMVKQLQDEIITLKGDN